MTPMPYTLYEVKIASENDEQITDLVAADSIDHAIEIVCKYHSNTSRNDVESVKIKEREIIVPDPTGVELPMGTIFLYEGKYYQLCERENSLDCKDCSFYKTNNCPEGVMCYDGREDDKHTHFKEVSEEEGYRTFFPEDFEQEGV